MKIKVSIDGNNLANGRKRYITVGTLGLVWGVIVHAADIHDGTKAHLLVEHGVHQKVWGNLNYILY